MGPIRSFALARFPFETAEWSSYRNVGVAPHTTMAPAHGPACDNWFAFSVFDGAADQIVVVTGAGDGAPVASALEVPVHSIRGARSTVVSMWSDGEVVIVHVDNDNNTGNSEFYAMLLE